MMTPPITPGFDEAPAAPWEVTVIGASAGGIDALLRLLPALPARFQIPIVIVLHLASNDAASTLPALFGTRCAMAVTEAADKLPIVPGTVYFAPAGYHLLLEADAGQGLSCALSVAPPINFSRPAIDALFESAAWACGPRTLGILLTGASADGTAGLAAIRAARGTTWVQRPDTAMAALMPASAIERGIVDEVLSIEQMASQLTALHEKLRMQSQTRRNDAQGDV